MAFNQFPYSNLHELNLDWLLQAWRSFHTSWDSADASAVQLPVNSQPTADLSVGDDAKPHFTFGIPRAVGDIKTVNGIAPDAAGDVQLPNSGVEHFAPNFRYYVDCINGNDDNDGLTQATAWKNLDKVFKTSNTIGGLSKVDVRAHLCSPGIYDIGADGQNIFTAMAIHISPLSGVTNCTVNLKMMLEMRFYDCHINFSGVTVTADSPTQKFFVDGGSFSLTNCIFRLPVYLFGANGHMGNSSAPTIHCKYSLVYLNDIVITNVDMNENAYTLDVSFVVFGGKNTNAYPAEVGTTNAFIKAVGSLIIGQCLLRYDGEKRYFNGLNAVFCIVLTNTETVNSWTNRSVNGITEKDNQGNLIIKADKNVILPTV